MPLNKLLNTKGSTINMSSSDWIAVISAIVSILSAVYAYRAVREAKKSNNIGRLNALLSFRQHYIELMRNQEKMAEILKSSESGMRAVNDRYAELDLKLREVGAEIDNYHSKIIKNNI